MQAAQLLYISPFHRLSVQFQSASSLVSWCTRVTQGTFVHCSKPVLFQMAGSPFDNLAFDYKSYRNVIPILR